MNEEYEKGKSLLPKTSAEDVYWYVILYRGIYGIGGIPDDYDMSMAYKTTLTKEDYKKHYEDIVDKIKRFAINDFNYDVPRITNYKFEFMSNLLTEYDVAISPIERVYEVRRRMSHLKGSFQPLVAFSLLAVAGLLIKPAQDAMLGLFNKKTTAVMTNVPGPKEKLKFCGSTIEENMFWVPQTGDVGVGVSILSYGGGVQFGLITDSTLCPDPQNIIDEFEPEFAKLAIVSLMMPWEG
jgi:hypothetical protein